MFDDCVIMAGGAGTRLWPASSSRLPKQFLPASDGMSFFSASVRRALALTGDNGRVIIITGKPHVPHVIRDAATLSAREKKRLLIIAEPCAKNTAPAVACAVIYSLLGGTDRSMLILTSDHIIGPPEVFRANAALAASCAKEGKLAVFGIPPTRAETGYGYIETGKERSSGVYNVASFHEKPDAPAARKYAASKRFFWNSGMFAFCTGFMADEFRRLAPDVIQPFEKLKSPKTYTASRGLKILDVWPGLENAYRKTKSISFDYAIAEKSPQCVMVRACFDWLDVGNWEEYAKLCGANGQETYSAASESCYVDS
ncbi:MAG: mannose-1-phosphate guanylyltransferase, partial [Treponema sp.]|nr:mannose-1-phosphate guanylyltransferase [Treponema sp.]